MDIEPVTLCACGCGKSLPPRVGKNKYYPARFILGHSGGRRAYVPTQEEIPSGLCECGCKQPTPIATRTHHGIFKGYPTRFLPGHAIRNIPQGKGASANNWKGGRWKHKTGYIYVYMPEHPSSNQDGHILEHRIVMEQKIGRPVLPDEIVHHINHVRDDNRPENLMLLSHKGHMHIHSGPRDYHPEVLEKLRSAGKKGAMSRWRRSD